MKTYLVGENIESIGFIRECELVDNISDAELIVFPDDQDSSITPSLYGCKKTVRTFKTDLSKDKKYIEIFKSIKPEQSVLGLGRGSELLCVVNHGKLIQKIRGHNEGVTHDIIGGNNEMYQITSLHTQLQYPFDLPKTDYKILYYSRRMSNVYEGDKIDNVEQIISSMGGEPEIVLYTKQNFPKCLAIQGRPDIIPDSPVSTMINKLINNYLIYENK